MRSKKVAFNLVSGLLLVWLGLLLLPSLVSAHADLVSSFPATGATITTPPEKIELTFSEPVAGGQVMLLHDDTTYTIPLLAEADGLTLRGVIDKALGAGVYQVLWTVTSTDNHTLTGSYQFEIKPSRQSRWLLIAGVVVFGLAVGAGFYLWLRYRVTPDVPMPKENSEV